MFGAANNYQFFIEISITTAILEDHLAKVQKDIHPKTMHIFYTEQIDVQLHRKYIGSYPQCIKL